MIISEYEIEKTIGPLVYGVADQAGVTKAIAKFIKQIREADVRHIIGETELRTNTEYTMEQVIKITTRDALRSEQRIRAGIEDEQNDHEG